MLARLGPASFPSRGRDTAARLSAVPYTRIGIPLQYWRIPTCFHTSPSASCWTLSQGSDN